MAVGVALPDQDQRTLPNAAKLIHRSITKTLIARVDLTDACTMAAFLKRPELTLGRLKASVELHGLIALGAKVMPDMLLSADQVLAGSFNRAF
jgi:hypothetical protein